MSNTLKFRNFFEPGTIFQQMDVFYGVYTNLTHSVDVLTSQVDAIKKAIDTNSLTGERIHFKTYKVDNGSKKFVKVEIPIKYFLVNQNMSQVILYGRLADHTYTPILISEPFNRLALSPFTEILSVYLPYNEQDFNKLMASVSNEPVLEYKQSFNYSNGTLNIFDCPKLIDESRDLISKGLPSFKNGTFFDGHGRINHLRSLDPTPGDNESKMNVITNDIELSDEYNHYPTDPAHLDAITSSQNLALSQRGADNMYRESVTIQDTKWKLNDRVARKWTDPMITGRTMLEELNSSNPINHVPESLADFWSRLHNYLRTYLQVKSYVSWTSQAFNPSTSVQTYQFTGGVREPEENKFSIDSSDINTIVSASISISTNDNISRAIDGGFTYKGNSYKSEIKWDMNTLTVTITKLGSVDSSFPEISQDFDTKWLYVTINTFSGAAKRLQVPRINKLHSELDGTIGSEYEDLSKIFKLADRFPVLKLKYIYPFVYSTLTNRVDFDRKDITYDTSNYIQSYFPKDLGLYGRYPAGFSISEKGELERLKSAMISEGLSPSDLDICMQWTPDRDNYYGGSKIYENKLEQRLEYNLGRRKTIEYSGSTGLEYVHEFGYDDLRAKIFPSDGRGLFLEIENIYANNSFRGNLKIFVMYKGYQLSDLNLETNYTITRNGSVNNKWDGTLYMKVISYNPDGYRTQSEGRPIAEIDPGTYKDISKSTLEIDGSSELIGDAVNKYNLVSMVNLIPKLYKSPGSHTLKITPISSYKDQKLVGEPATWNYQVSSIPPVDLEINLRNEVPATFDEGIGDRKGNTFIGQSKDFRNRDPHRDQQSKWRFPTHLPNWNPGNEHHNSTTHRYYNLETIIHSAVLKHLNYINTPHRSKLPMSYKVMEVHSPSESIVFPSAITNMRRYARVNGIVSNREIYVDHNGLAFGKQSESDWIPFTHNRLHSMSNYLSSGRFLLLFSYKTPPPSDYVKLKIKTWGGVIYNLTIKY